MRRAAPPSTDRAPHARLHARGARPARLGPGGERPVGVARAADDAACRGARSRPPRRPASPSAGSGRCGPRSTTPPRRPSAREQAMLLGGLTGADTSRSDILIVKRDRGRPARAAPRGLHDAAAVRLGAAVYLFGGGNGVAQLDRILRIDPAERRREPRRAGCRRRAPTRPPPRSAPPRTSSGATRVRDGSTRSSPGGRAARRAWSPTCPRALRYAAVAAAAGRLVIAGGSRPTARRATPCSRSIRATARVTRTRPPAGAHDPRAAAAALGDDVYVIGGRGAPSGRATDRIVAVDPGRGRIAPAGRLPAPRRTSRPWRWAAASCSRAAAARAGHAGHLSELVPARRRSGRPRLRALATSTRRMRPESSARPRGARSTASTCPTARATPSTSSTRAPTAWSTHFPVGRPAPARRPLVGSAHPLRDQRHRQQPHARSTRAPAGPGARSRSTTLQHVLHPRRALRHRRGRAQRAASTSATPHTMRLRQSLPVPCRGVDHLDFSADGRVPARQLRVLGPAGEGRRRAPTRGGDAHASATAARCPRTSSSPPTGASSTSRT